MFRTRPPVYALACVGLWGLQLAVAAVLLVFSLGGAGGAHWGWHAAGVALSLLLGALLLLQLPRALRWRPRRSLRASREVMQERQRIARDLHDHVGLQLVAAVESLGHEGPSSQELARRLEQCLLDLRLVVDSMDGDDDALPDRLARLRHRLEPALQRRGIVLHWQVALDSEIAWPTGPVAREVAAIAQEAMSNALQHAQASELTVVLGPVPAGTEPEGSAVWMLQIQDNGKGGATADLTAPAVGAGAGLRSMRRRAETLGARLYAGPAPGGGVCVQLLMPSAAGRDAAAR